MFPTGKYFPKRVSRELHYVLSRFNGAARDQVGNPSRLVLIQTKAVPPVEQYDAWLDSVVSHDPRCRTPATGARLRRAVVMVRGGSTVADANKAIGCNIRRWFNMLPPELRA